MDNYLIFWLITFIVLLVCELVSSALVSVWFCGGALVAIVANLLSAPFLIQLIIFIIVSAVLLIITRPLAKKILKKDTLKTNVSSIIGKKAVVTKEIDNTECIGEINVNGQIWSARSFDDEIIKESSNVVIEDIQGVKAIVKQSN